MNAARLTQPGECQEPGAESRFVRGPFILLAPREGPRNTPPVRILKMSLAVTAILAGTHGFAALPVPQASTPQRAEVKEQQETVNLTISGMT